MKIVDDSGNELPVGRRDLRQPAGARALGDQELLQGGQRPARVRQQGEGLVPDRRRGDHRRGRLHAHHRPQQGRHQVGRRMDQLDRAREPRHGPSGGRQRGGHRRRPSQVGRAAAADRGAEARRRGFGGRHPVDLRGQGRQVVDAGRRAVRRGDSARAPPARSSRRSCASSSRTTACRPPEPRGRACRPGPRRAPGCGGPTRADVRHARATPYAFPPVFAPPQPDSRIRSIRHDFARMPFRRRHPWQHVPFQPYHAGHRPHERRIILGSFRSATAALRRRRPLRQQRCRRARRP